MESTGKVNLVSKLAAIMAEIKRVPKSGHNKFHGYDYATNEDILDLVRGLMAKQGVVLLPSVTAFTREDRASGKDKTTALYTVNVDMVFMGDGETLVSKWVGEASDTSDKGLNKALTAAVKYFLLKTFLISSGEPQEDADSGGPELTADNAVTPAQVADLEKILATKGKTLEQIEGYCDKEYNKGLGQLTQPEFLAVFNRALALPDKGSSNNDRVKQLLVGK